MSNRRYISGTVQPRSVDRTPQLEALNADGRAGNPHALEAAPTSGA